MSPADLLAELHGRGIAVRATSDGHLRLTGAAEAALTPALRRAVAAQRPELVALLATEGSGRAGAASALHPLPPDAAAPRPQPADQHPSGEQTAPPGEARSRVSGWLGWGLAGLAAAALAVAYLIGRPSEAAQDEAPAPSPVPGWPYTGWQSWGL